MPLSGYSSACPIDQACLIRAPPGEDHVVVADAGVRLDAGYAQRFQLFEERDVCAVTGLRGVGKTQVAAAYVRDRVAARCGLVGWVNAESRDMLLVGLARVADAVGVADPEGDSARSAVRLREHLQARVCSYLTTRPTRTVSGRSCPPLAARRSW